MYSLSIILYIIIYSYSICIIKNQSYLKYIELAGYITFLKIIIDTIYWNFIVCKAVYIHYPIKSSNNSKKASIIITPNLQMTKLRLWEVKKCSI